MLQTNKFYCGDNIEYLKQIDSDTIQLIYIDPFFNSGRKYNHNEIEFEDKFDTIDDYINWLNPRIKEIQRILTPTGLFYCHCDKNASHYIKVLCDSIFGISNFQSEITWVRTVHPHSISKTYDNILDSILIYSKSNQFYFQPQYTKLTEQEIQQKFKHREKETGRLFFHASIESSMNASNKHEVRIIQGKTCTTNIGWKWTQQTIDEKLQQNPHLIYWTKNHKPRYKIYLDAFKGVRIPNLWSDILPIEKSSKNYHYPTQKPYTLMERILQSSSQKNDLVLDCFCGSGIFCKVAYDLSRNYIGIDINPDAIHIAKQFVKTMDITIDDIINKQKQKI